MASPVQTGWLQKHGSATLRPWKKRWFVLSSHKLTYYDTDSMKVVKGEHTITTKTTTIVAPDQGRITNIFSLSTGETNLLLSASNSADRDAWMSAIRSIVTRMSTPPPLPGFVRAPPIPPTPPADQEVESDMQSLTSSSASLKREDTYPRFAVADTDTKDISECSVFDEMEENSAGAVPSSGDSIDLAGDGELTSRAGDGDGSRNHRPPPTLDVGSPSPVGMHRPKGTVIADRSSTATEAPLDFNTFFVEYGGKDSRSFINLGGMFRSKEKSISMALRKSAINGDIAYLRNVLLSNNLITAAGMVQGETDRIKGLFNDKGSHGLNVLHCCLLGKQSKYLALLLHVFDSVIDTSIETSLQPGVNAYEGVSITFPSKSTCDMIISTLLVEYQMKSSLTDMDGNAVEALVSMSLMLVMFNIKQPAVSESRLNDHFTDLRLEDEGSSGLGAEAELELRLSKDIIATLAAIRHARDIADSDQLRICMLQFNHKMNLINLRKKDSIIIEYAEIIGVHSKFHHEELVLEALFILKDLVLSNISGRASVHFAATQKAVFEPLDQYTKYYQKILDEASPNSMQFLISMKGLYVSTVTSALAAGQFKFVGAYGENKIDSPGKRFWISVIPRLVGAFRGNTTDALWFLEGGMKIVKDAISNQLEQRQLRLVFAVESLGYILIKLADGAEKDLKLKIIDATIEIFIGLKTSMMQKSEWIVFYACLELLLTLGLDEIEDVQLKVCEFLLDNVYFEPTGFRGTMLNRIWNDSVVELIRCKVTECLLSISASTTFESVKVLCNPITTPLKQAKTPRPRAARASIGALNDRLMKELVNERKNIFQLLKRISKNLAPEELMKYVRDRIINKRIEDAIEDAAAKLGSVNKPEHLMCYFCTFLIDIATGKYESVESMKGVTEHLAPPLEAESNFRVREDIEQLVEAENATAHYGQSDLGDTKSVNNKLISIPDFDPAGLSDIIQFRAEKPDDSDLPVGESISLLRHIISLGNTNLKGKELRDLLLFVGDSGSGKSTTANLLAGVKMVRKEARTQWVVDVAEGSAAVARIGHGESETLVPQVMNIPDNNWKMTDTPGLVDTRGFEFSIANAVNIRQLLHKATNVRIMLFISYNAYQANRKMQFTELIRRLKGMFSGKINDFAHSIIVGITHVDELNDVFLGGLIDELREKAHTQEWDIPPGHILPIDPTEKWATRRRHLLMSALSSLSPINSPADSFKVALNSGELHKLNGVLEEICLIKELLSAALVHEVLKRYEILTALLFLDQDCTRNSLNVMRTAITVEVEERCATLLLAVQDEDVYKRIKTKSMLEKLETFEILDKCWTDDQVNDRPISTKINDIKASIRSKEEKLQQGKFEQAQTEYNTFSSWLIQALNKIDDDDDTSISVEELKQLADINTVRRDQLLMQVANCSAQFEHARSLHALFSNIEREIRNRPFEYINSSLVPLNEFANTSMQTILDIIVKAINHAIVRFQMNAYSEARNAIATRVDEIVNNSYERVYYLLSNNDASDAVCENGVTSILLKLKECDFPESAIVTIKKCLHSLTTIDATDDVGIIELSLQKISSTIYDKSKVLVVDTLCSNILERLRSPVAYCEISQLQNDLKRLYNIDSKAFDVKVKEVVRAVFFNDPLRKLKHLTEEEYSKDYVPDVAGVFDVLQKAQSILHCFADGEVQKAEEDSITQVEKSETEKATVIIERFHTNFDIAFQEFVRGTNKTVYAEHFQHVLGGSHTDDDMAKQLLECDLPEIVKLREVVREFEAIENHMTTYYYYRKPPKLSLLEEIEACKSAMLEKVTGVSVYKSVEARISHPLTDEKSFYKLKRDVQRLYHSDVEQFETLRSKIIYILVDDPVKRIAVVNSSERSNIAELKWCLRILELAKELDFCFPHGLLDIKKAEQKAAITDSENQRIAQKCAALKFEFQQQLETFKAACATHAQNVDLKQLWLREAEFRNAMGWMQCLDLVGRIVGPSAGDIAKVVTTTDSIVAEFPDNFMFSSPGDLENLSVHLKQTCSSVLDNMITVSSQDQILESFQSCITEFKLKGYELVNDNPEMFLKNRPEDNLRDAGMSVEEVSRPSMLVKRAQFMNNKDLEKRLLVEYTNALNDIELAAIRHFFGKIVPEGSYGNYIKEIPDKLARAKELNQLSYVEIIEIFKYGLQEIQKKENIEYLVQLQHFQKLTTIFSTLKALKLPLESHGITIRTDEFSDILSGAVRQLYSKARAEISRCFETDTQLHLEDTKLFVNVKKALQANGLIQEAMITTIRIECIDAILLALDSEFEIFRRQESNYEAAKKFAFAILKAFVVTPLLDLSVDDLRVVVCTLLEKLPPNAISIVGITIIGCTGNYQLGEYADAANEIIRTIPQFRSLNISLYNTKAGQVTFANALDKVRIAPGSGGTGVPLSSIACGKLGVAHDAFTTVYSAQIGLLIDNPSQVDRLISEIHSKLDILKGKLSPFVMSLGSKPAETGELIGYICAVWTLLDAKGRRFNGEKSTLLQPHGTQLLAILRLLAVDVSALKNHLAQIKTGEGKSISLGVLAAVFSLLDCNVHVVCYSEYLSNRDEDAFADLFNCLGVRGGITYCTIDELASNDLRNQLKYNLITLVKALLAKKTIPEKNEPKRSILLIDEVDVFFGELFYGNSYNPLVMLDGEEGKELVKHVFSTYRGQEMSLSLVDIIMNTRQAKALLKSHPGLKRFLPNEIYCMLDNLQAFPRDSTREMRHMCIFKDGTAEIGYRNEMTDSIEYNSHRGYYTMFAYLYFCENGKIGPHSVGKHTSVMLNIRGGCIPYAELPKMHDAILGLTGSLDCLSDGDNEILGKYNFDTRTYVPSTFEKQEVFKTPILVENGAVGDDPFFKTVKAEIMAGLVNRRTMLVVFYSRDILQAFEEKLKMNIILHKDYQFPEVLHEDLTKSQKTGVISRSMTKCAITLMTRGFGRGTDFSCNNPEVISNGGVHVILTFNPSTASEEVQIMGRTCRQDNPGSFARIFARDDLIRQGVIDKDSDNSDYQKHGSSWEFLSDKRTALDSARVKKMIESNELSSDRYRNTHAMFDSASYRATDALDALYNIQLYTTAENWFRDQQNPPA